MVGCLVCLEDFMYINMKNGGIYLVAACSWMSRVEPSSWYQKPQPSCSAYLCRITILFSYKVVVTVASIMHHVTFFFLLSFLLLCFVFSSILLLLLPLSSPVHTGKLCSVWLETCMQRSSAPLRTCSWMVKTLASCCSPGVAYASHDTSFSESADRPGISSAPDQPSLVVSSRTCSC